MAFCNNCGNEISAQANACPKCGHPQISSDSGGKSRMTAALLAFFLGGIGAHKFYLGETGKGILFLCFCWTLIPSICGFIDFISFLSITDSAFDKKYN